MKTTTRLFALAVLAACSREPAKVTSLADAPAAWKEPIARSERAMGALQQALLQRLTAALSQGGPAAAITVCRDEAQAESARVQRDEGVALGRTSHQLRNPSNAPRPWVAPLLERAAGKPAAEVEAQVVDLGDRLGVVKPIGVMPLCVSCHGASERIPADVQQVLARAYPQDRAVGFSEGDFRGFLWAEVPK